MATSGATARPQAEARQARLPKASRRGLRLFPLGTGALAMIFGLWTGLAQIGLPLPVRALPPATELHAALMISGFLGTVISLERSVALDRWWSYLAPALSSIGALLLVAGIPHIPGIAFLAAGVLLLLASASLAARVPALFTIVLAIAAACWAVGTFDWVMGRPMPDVVGWWLDFLILTIAAERLELSRMGKLSAFGQITFTIVVLLLLLGSARGELAATAAPLTAAGLLGLCAWLLRYDIARRVLRQEGQARFAAVSILAGHMWLGAAGLLLLIIPPYAMSFSLDAAVHAITIGFVLSMLFGHAPIILPALIGLRMRYASFSYVPLAILHISVILRVGSDLLEWTDLRVGSSLATVLALVSYAGCLAAMSRQSASA
jgi:hypothetical protein